MRAKPDRLDRMVPTVTDEDRAAVAKTRAEDAAGAAAERREAVAEVREIDARGVPCRLYRPAVPVGLFLYFHGGGFVYGDLDTHDAHCRRMANRTRWAVLAVHYRRAPEAAYPAAAEDVATVVGWIVDKAPQLLGRRPVVVGGDSAGGNLALGVALRHPTAFSGLVLVYPFLDTTCDTYDRSITVSDLPVEDAAWFWRMYLQELEADAEVRADPLRAESYAGLPPTLLQLAQLDVLTPTGRLLADRLAGDEVPVDVVVYPGVGHGFWRRDDNDQHEPAQEHLAGFLSRFG
jgi:acetyl esterase/lipase